jgi:hypothetical protein
VIGLAISPIHLSLLVEAIETGAETEVVIARNGRARRLGVARGQFTVPDSIDASNPLIAIKHPLTRSDMTLSAAPMASRQRQPLQACNPFEIAIETHQAPAIGDRQGRQMGIFAEPGRDLPTPQQLVKHLPAVVLRLGQLHARLLTKGIE